MNEEPWFITCFTIIGAITTFVVCIKVADQIFKEIPPIYIIISAVIILAILGVISHNVKEWKARRDLLAHEEYLKSDRYAAEYAAWKADDELRTAKENDEHRI